MNVQQIRKKDLLISSGMAIAAILVGAIAAFSTNRWMESHEQGFAEVELAKRELLRSAGLGAAHHAIYSKVGEERWERTVKPAFLSAITVATARETMDPFPDWRMVVEWVRAHPEEARRMLKNAAAE